MKRDALKLHLLSPLLLLFTTSACGLGFPATIRTPAAPTALTPAAQSSPTVPLASPLPAQVGSSRYFVEAFNADVTGWTTFVTSGELGLLDLRVETGFWVFDLGGKNMNAFALYQSESYKNMRVDVRVVNREESANRVSLICRYSEKEGWYQFDIFNTGLYNIYFVAWDKEKQAGSILLAEGGSKEMSPNVDGNELGAICSERSLSLFINGVEVRTISESRFFLREGQVGVGVSSFTRLPVRVDFDWVRISQP